MKYQNISLLSSLSPKYYLTLNRYKKVTFVFGLAALALAATATGAQAGTWSAPTKIVQTGSWGPWFGVVVTDPGAASGCSGTGTKAIDISTFTPTSKAQVALLLAA